MELVSAENLNVDTELNLVVLDVSYPHIKDPSLIFKHFIFYIDEYDVIGGKFGIKGGCSTGRGAVCSLDFGASGSGLARSDRDQLWLTLSIKWSSHDLISCEQVNAMRPDDDVNVGFC